MKTELRSTIWKPDMSGFRIPTEFRSGIQPWLEHSTASQLWYQTSPHCIFLAVTSILAVYIIFLKSLTVTWDSILWSVTAVCLYYIWSETGGFECNCLVVRKSWSNYGTIIIFRFKKIMYGIFYVLLSSFLFGNFLPCHCFSDGIHAQSWCFTFLENFVRFGGFSNNIFSLFGLLRRFFINFFFFFYFEFGQNDWRERIDKDRLSRRFVSGRAWRFWRWRRVVEGVTRDIVWWRS